MERGIIVVGSANVDSVIRVGRAPMPGETVLGTVLLSEPGGKGLNQAVAAARSGAPVQLIATLGEDSGGSTIRRMLAAEHIGHAHVGVASLATGSAHIYVDDVGENSIVVIPGANAEAAVLSPAQAQTVTGAAILLLQGEVPVELSTASAALARDAGARVVLTPAPVGPFLAEGRSACRALLALVDLLVPNEQEAIELARFLSEADVVDAESAIHVLREYCPMVVVTVGARGALVSTEDDSAFVEGIRVTARDTTGAGDTFVGVLAASLLVGAPLVAAARRATASAALAVQRDGASAAIPLAADIDTFQEMVDHER